MSTRSQKAKELRSQENSGPLERKARRHSKPDELLNAIGISDTITMDETNTGISSSAEYFFPHNNNDNVFDFEQRESSYVRRERLSSSTSSHGSRADAVITTKSHCLEKMESSGILPKYGRRRHLRLQGASDSICSGMLNLDQLDDIFRVYYEDEPQFTSRPYMLKQKDINEKFRAILVDWLCEVHYRFKFSASTLWVTVNLLDRYLEKNNEITRQKLQLVGVTTLLIACKECGDYPLEVHDCVYITDFAYVEKDITTMEVDILASLDYNTSVPTGYYFLCHYLDSINANRTLRNLVFFYAERNLQEYDMLNVIPHHFCAAALYAALVQQNQYSKKCYDNDCWPYILEEETGLKETAIINIARQIVMHVQEEPETPSKRRLNAIRKKYSSKQYCFVAFSPIPNI